MRIGAMLGNIFHSLFKSPATVLYPAERTPTPDRLRGNVVWDSQLCTGCNLCQKDCPAGAIRVVILDRKEKQFVMEYEQNHCIYCSQCVESCRTHALHLSHTVWELAALSQDTFKVYYGSDDNIRKHLGKDLADAAASGS
jgi:formate hydrogenlyase subunit 6/NADH:ubiquinone oxidoreductase subunit I